ncbi:MAG: hypothetical protein JNL58_08990 [Planctomyces sp.]|nr:hypothetical protein [Planctomyces sp.]
MSLSRFLLIVTSLTISLAPTQGSNDSLVTRVAEDLDAFWSPLANATIHFEVESQWDDHTVTSRGESRNSYHTKEVRELTSANSSFHLYSTLQSLPLDGPTDGQLEISEELVTRERHLGVTYTSDGSEISVVQGEKVPPNSGECSEFLQGFLRSEYLPALIKSRKWTVERPSDQKAVLTSTEEGRRLVLKTIQVNGQWRPESLHEKGKHAENVFTFVDFGEADGVPYVSELRKDYESTTPIESSGSTRKRTSVSTFRVTSCQPGSSVTPESLRLRIQIPNGQPVTVWGSEWLHYAWQDGNVIPVTDPDAMRRLEDFEFINQQAASRWKWILLGITFLVITGGWIWRKQSLSSFLLLILMLLSDRHADAAEHEQNQLPAGSEQHDSVRRTHFEDPYCGIVCAWVLLNHFDREPEFRSLIRLEYVGSWEGSTGRQIQTLLDNHGVSSSAIVRGNTGTLSALNGPAILHTRSRTTPLYRHWISFLALKVITFACWTRGTDYSI